MTLRSQNKSGFTLIEVLIAMTLLTFISFAIFQSIRQSFKVREILSTEGDFYNSIRLAMEAMNRDIMVMYTPLAYGNPATKRRSNAYNDETQDPESDRIRQFPDLGVTSKFWSSAVHSIGLRPSRFTGTETMMSFISTSHVRVYRSTPESEFVQIGYELKTIKDSRSLGTTQALIRSENVNAFTLRDNENAKELSKIPLLENIQSIKFRYYRAEKEEWLNQWDSTSTELLQRLPDVIEVQIDVKNSERLKFIGTYRFRPEVPTLGVPATL